MVSQDRTIFEVLLITLAISKLAYIMIAYRLSEIHI